MSCSADTASQRKKGKYKFDVALIYANNKKTLIILKIIRLSNSINFQLTSEVPVLLPDQLENSPAPINSLHQTFPCLFISLFPPFHTLLFYFLLFLSKLLHLPPCSNDSGQVMNTTVLPTGIKN